MTQRKITAMTKIRTLLAATFTLALTAGSAYAAGSEYAFGSARPSYPVPMADGSAASAPAISGSSGVPLSALLRDWDRTGFGAPSKPAQFRVVGRDGYVTSGPGYNAMVSLIRSAVRDSREGRDQDALVKIARVRTLLGR